MPNIVGLQSSSDIEGEASAWIVQLHGKKPTDEDLHALSEWMKRSPAHRAAVTRLLAVWDEANALTSLLEEVAAAPAARGAPSRRWRVGAWAAAAAASLAVLAFVATAALSGGAWPLLAKTYQTQIGGQRNIMLADGSDMRLNTNSKVQTHYTRAVRSVYLRRGEAAFEVRSDAARPFEVHAGGSIIRAVGTAFTVRLNGEAVELTVAEGSVECSADNASRRPARQIFVQRVGALQTAHLVDGAALAIHAIDEDTLSRSLSWRYGVLVFQGEPLEDVVKEIARYTPTEFVFADPSLKSIRIGGHFAVGEVDGLIAALKGSFGIDARRDGKGRIVLSGDQSEQH
jgi:transmembrane sensor